jgi:plastocyanin
MTKLALLTLAALLAAAMPAAAEDVVIEIDNFTFNPPSVSVKAGSTVVFVNADDIPHSIVDEKTRFRSKVLDTDEKFTMTVSEPGEIGYFCGLHPHMRGHITVTP